MTKPISSLSPSLQDPLPNEDTVAVWGLGWTGVQAANALARAGKHVIGCDTRTEEDVRKALESLRTTRGVELDPRVVVHPEGFSHTVAKTIVQTQAAPHFSAPVQDARALGLNILPEVEIAARMLPPSTATLAVIAGTDGKTTTTRLTHHLIATQRLTHIGGNSWPPLSEAVQTFAAKLDTNPTHPDGAPLHTYTPVLVVEISAFQMPPWQNFHPRVAAVTNVAEDHVEEYFEGSMEKYAAAKRAPTDHLTHGDCAVLNVDDPIVRTWEENIRARGARVMRTTLSRRAAASSPDAVFLSNGVVMARLHGVESRVLSAQEIPLLGDHNIENVLTAVGVCLALGLEIDPLRDAIRSFTPPPHRLQHIGRVGSVDVFDDSKATNAHASIAGLAAFGARPLVAIVGGVDKGLDLDAWISALRAQCRAVVVIGELRERIQRDYANTLPNLTYADSMRDAVHRAHTLALPQDAIVLTPACSSFDMFSSYADRGRIFQECVGSLDGFVSL